MTLTGHLGKWRRNRGKH